MALSVQLRVQLRVAYATGRCCHTRSRLRQPHLPGGSPSDGCKWLPSVRRAEGAHFGTAKITKYYDCLHFLSGQVCLKDTSAVIRLVFVVKKVQAVTARFTTRPSTFNIVPHSAQNSSFDFEGRNLSALK